jgi:putative hydrolase of the HAD superfamily
MKTLVCDIGGIFFHPAWRLEGIDQASRNLKVSVAAFKEALNSEKKSFYTGRLSENEYWSGVIQSLGITEATTEDLKSLYRKYVRPNPETLELLPKLASRYKLIACNNCPKEWMDYRVKIASLDSSFSKFFTSGYVGSMKPDEEMYAKVFSEDSAANTIYMDDDAKYVSIVQDRYGVRSLVYNGIEDLLFWIR